MAEKVQYIVEVSKIGDGAAQTVADLQAVQAAAANTGKSLAAAGVSGATTTQQIATLGSTTKTLTSGLRAMQGTLTLIGLSTFPALTLAANTAASAVNGLKAASAVMGTSLAATSAGAAVAAASVYSVSRAVQEYLGMLKAAKLDPQSGLADTVEAQAAALHKTLVDALDAGKISLTEFERDYIDRLLLKPTYERLKIIRDLVRDKMPSGTFLSDAEKGRIAASTMADFNRERAWRVAAAQWGQPGLFDLSKVDSGQRFRQIEAEDLAQRQYNDTMAMYNQLLKDGYITQQQLDAFSMEADTARLQRLTQINAQVESTKLKFASLREIEADAIQNFASGLANTLVDVKAWTKDAGAAFASFFANLAQSIASAIAQMLILRALKSAFPSFFGAAEGGVFPRMMAAGGIQTVSSPTYYPRFNVVAGEAGTEMMAVLSRPRLMNLGGIEAAVGNAQGNRLAIASADALASRGAGGGIVIEVRHSPETEARIISNSVDGAVVRVTRDAQRNTPLREAVRKA